jgi:hypothetical protein
MEAAIRELMGAGTPPRFKFKDTYASIEFPAGYTVPSQATLEAKYNELLALEEDIQKTVIEGDLEVGTSNLFVDTETGNVGVGTASPIAALDIDAGANDTTTPALAIRGGYYDTSDLYVLNTYNTNTGVGYAAKVIGVNIKNKVETDNTVQIRNNVGGLDTAGAIYLGSDDLNQGIFGVLGGVGVTGTTLSEHLTVRAGGNVGIGVANPAVKLDVNGTIRTSSTSTNIVTDSGSDVTINSGTPTTFASVTITTRGNKVLVICSGDLQPSSGTGDWLDMKFYRGTTAIGKAHRYHPGTAGSTNQVFAMHVIDQPSTGTYTYYAKGYRGSGNTFFGENDNPQITAIEFL